MKKLLVLMLGLLVFSCGAKTETTEGEKAETKVEQTQTSNQITLESSEKEQFVLVSEDNYETAKLNDVELKRVESADGIKLSTEDGALSIHFKLTDGVISDAVVTKDGKDITVTEVK